MEQLIAKGVIGKGVYVVGSCTIAAWAVSLFYSTFNRTASVFGAVALALCLGYTFWLGTRGKPSQSWAVLAFGSWMVVHEMIYLQILLGSTAASQTLWAWVTGGAILLVCRLGFKAALRGHWGGVLAWWAVSFFLVVLYGIWDSQGRL
jgi:hypothetical protein